MVSSRKAQKQSLLRQNQFAVKCKSNYSIFSENLTVPRNPASKNLFSTIYCYGSLFLSQIDSCGTFRFFPHVVTAAQKRSAATTTFVYTDTAWYLSLHHLAVTVKGSIRKKCLSASRKMRNITKPCHLYYWLRHSTDAYSSYKV